MHTHNAHNIALMTGATGFIGSHLAQRLLAEDWTVHAIVRHGSDLSSLHALQPEVIVHYHDGSTENMISIVAESKPTVVFHLASFFLVQHRSNDVEQLVRSNILFGTQLAEAMVINNVYALVNTGTSWQHFENRAYSPVCLYAATKQAFEAILQFYVETSPLQAITLKLFDTYGPGDSRPKLFTLLRKSIREQQPLAMSPGEQLIDLVYIDDVVQSFITAATLLLTKTTGRNEEYAISSQAPIRLKDLVELYGRIVNKKIPVEWGSRPYRLREVMVPWSSNRKLPGWKPMIGIEEGIRRMEMSVGNDQE
jgi:nucleoside-diphosphate-sugar epimerase